ncbi:spore maturation protein [Vulgatibacter sp.]|uniref:spore maturation protein n=1 Tax=Vulgatibacter sp. TaxID=1971226 RepID=UPI0035676C49
MEALIRVLDLISKWAIPIFLVGVPAVGLARGVKIYTAFVEGAKEGFEVAVRIIPYLVAILAAVGAFRGAGAMDLIATWLAPVLEPLGIPASVLPMMLVRPLSGSGANGVLGDLIRSEGPDSFAARMAAVMAGSTETTFYVLAVYFGAAGVTKYRHAIPAALLADLAGFVAAIAVTRLVFG